MIYKEVSEQTKKKMIINKCEGEMKKKKRNNMEEKKKVCIKKKKI